MAKLELFGSYVALITPFTADDQVDYTILFEFLVLLLNMTAAVFCFYFSGRLRLHRGSCRVACSGGHSRYRALRHHWRIAHSERGGEMK
jgi:hypothetical protein